MSAIMYLMIRTFSTDSNGSHEIFSPDYRLCPDQPNIAIQANKDIGTFLHFTLSYLGIVSELQVPIDSTEHQSPAVRTPFILFVLSSVRYFG